MTGASSARAPERTGDPDRRDAFVTFGPPRLAHLPGLDGLRGLAVAAVVLFHGNYSWATGGYLGVSLFFTLSGFLITSVIMNNTSSDAFLAPGFWTARFKRLLPAAWLTLLAILAASWYFDERADFLSVKADALFAWAQVANWRFMAEDTSYGDLFVAPSPVLHFWSLSIEEQFYLLFPFLIAGISYVSRRSRRMAMVALGLGAAASWSLPVLLDFSSDRTYFGTGTRAGELLAGAGLAVWVNSERVRRMLTSRLYWRIGVAGAGSVAAALAIVGVLTLDQSSAFLHSGGLALISATSVLLVLSAAVPAGPVGLVGRIPPLIWLGRISYGVYLFHWPIFVYATTERTGLSRTPLFIVSVVVTLALAELSSRFVEQPIRRSDSSDVFVRRRLLVGASATAAILLVAVAAVPARNPDVRLDFDEAVSDLEELTNAAEDRLAEDPADPTAPEGAQPGGYRPRVSFFGDSVALTLGLMMDVGEPEDLTVVGGSADLGCSLIRGGLRRFEEMEPQDDVCDRWPTTYVETVERTGTDMAVISTGQWEIVERILPEQDDVFQIGDPEMDAAIYEEFLAATDVLSSTGAKVAWLTLADYGATAPPDQPQALTDSRTPERVRRLNEIIRLVAATRPGDATVVDLAAFMEPRVDDMSLRRDGSHYNTEAGNPVVDFLNIELLEAWEELGGNG